MHVVLIHPEIPQNTGNIGRTCVAVHAKLWLVGPLGFRLDDHHLRRAGLDYWQHLQWEVVPNWSALLAQLPDARMWYFSRHAERLYTTVVFQPQDVLVFGSETRGLPASIWDQAPAEHRLRIPTTQDVRSLNLACSVAVACYELVRQYPW